MISFEKNLEKLENMFNFFWSFLTVKSNFFKNDPSKWVLFFALQAVRQGASFKLLIVAIQGF